MTYEDDVEFLIRVGLGRNEWTLLIYYPDNADGNFSGSRYDAIALAHERIDRWIRPSSEKRNWLPDFVGGWIERGPQKVEVRWSNRAGCHLPKRKTGTACRRR